MENGRTLFLNGTIADESWYDDDVTPQLFKNDLYNGSGDVTVWLNSPGGDCVAAAQIYNMLKEYPGNITIKIDGIAASAASLIAMAGDNVLMSPVSMMMIHNPLTMAVGNADDMQKANLQEIFLTKVRKQALSVTVFLMNGFQLRGVITGFDSFSLVLDSDGRQQFIYKHAVSTLVPLHPLSLREEEGDD